MGIKEDSDKQETTVSHAHNKMNDSIILRVNFPLFPAFSLQQLAFKCNNIKKEVTSSSNMFDVLKSL